MQPLVLNKTCRYCPSCDLIILHQDELEELLAAMCMQLRKPDLIGNDYLVIGTVDRAAWKKGQQSPGTSIEAMRSSIYDFKKVLEFEVQPYGWVKD
jgi:ABC-type tungstate transport system permease subunit